MDTNKASSVGFTGKNKLKHVGDENKTMKIILDEVPVTITEQEVDEMNQELGVVEHNRPTSRLILALIKGVNYLKVRLN